MLYKLQLLLDHTNSRRQMDAHAENLHDDTVGF